MRFVEPKSTEQQGSAVLFRTHPQFIRQRTEAVNALRGHLFEFGHIAPVGVHQALPLAEFVEGKDSNLPSAVRLCSREVLLQTTQLSERLQVIDREIAHQSGQRDTARPRRTMPGVGPITALAVETIAPSMDSFGCGRDFAAWLGLGPLQKSTGGKQLLGRASKMGQHDIRRLLIIRAISVVQRTLRKGAVKGSWLARLLAKKPRMLVAIALDNKNEDYRGAMAT